ncbi:MAG: hypothetical protein NC226_12095 [Bacteroides cellulosilyticus]|nr:hypothetical protein [Bacteroides cellulosilyticus]
MLHTLASGYRNRDTGALTNVGTEGDYWSSSSTAAGSTTPSGLDFNTGYVDPLHSFAGRAHALPVRCVQHLQLLFQDVIK